MKRILVLTLGIGLVLVGSAAAKGPTSATITGPGLSKPIVLDGDSEGNSSSRFGRLVEQSGWFPEVYRQTPDSTTRVRPRGLLGARYDAVYLVPDGNGKASTIEQELYPFAVGGPVTHVRPGQQVFGSPTHGGWYRSSPALRGTLRGLGLPAEAPSFRSSGLGAGAWAGIAVGIALALSIAQAAAARRRRTAPGRPAY